MKPAERLSICPVAFFGDHLGGGGINSRMGLVCREYETFGLEPGFLAGCVSLILELCPPPYFAPY